MQPQQIKGFNYAPIAITPYQDPWAAYRLALQAKEEEERRRQEIEKANGNKGKGRLGNNPLSAWISELGGAGGAVGGAATGAALGSVVPGVGNIVGGIAGGIVGGFAGGAGGRLAENKLRDDEFRLGDALKEGAVSGAFGAIGPAWQGARGLSALGKASGNAGFVGGINALNSLGDDAAKEAGKAIARSGAKAGRAVGQGMTGESLKQASRKGLLSTGDRARGWQRGIVSGNQTLSPEQVVDYNKALDGVNRWFSGVGNSRQYTNADDAIKALGNQFKKSPEATKTFGKANADDLAERFLANIDDNVALRDTLKGKNAKIVENLLDDAIGFGKKKNGDFVDFMASKINTRYRTISSGGSAGSVESQVLEAFRDAGKSLIDEKLVTRSGVNKQMASLLGAKKQLGSTITRDVGAGASQGLNLGRILHSVAGPGVDLFGRGAQQVGKVSQYTTPIAVGALARGVTNQGGQQSNTEQPPSDLSSALGTDPMSADLMGGMGDPMAGAMQQPQQQYTLQNALQEAYGLLGADQTPATYLSYAKALMEASEGAGGATANQKTAAAKAEGANRIIDELEGVFNQSGGARGPIEGRIGQLGSAMGGGNQALKSYQDLRSAYTAQISRALGEVGVLTDKDREVIQRAIPSVNDSQEAAQIKLQTLRNILGQLVQQNSGGDASNDLINAIAQQVNNQGYTQ